MSDFIELTMPSGELIYVNTEMIDCFQKSETPGCNGCIEMCGGNRYWVKESPKEIMSKIEEWKKLNDPQTIEKEDERMAREVQLKMGIMRWQSNREEEERQEKVRKKNYLDSQGSLKFSQANKCDTCGGSFYHYPNCHNYYIHPRVKT